MSATNFILSVAFEKIRDLEKSKRPKGIWRPLLLKRLVIKLTAEQDTTSKEADRAACGADARIRQRGLKRQRAEDEVEKMAEKQQVHSHGLRWREERAREFIAALEPSRIDMKALDEELGPEPDIEFLDD